MRLQATTLLVAILAALTMALPTAQNFCKGDKSKVGHCTTLSFTDTSSTTPNPATTAECNNTCFGVTSDPGDWIVDFRGQPSGYVDNMVLYPCGFSVGRGAGEPNDYFFSMDNQDIIDILDEVNQRYGPLHGGKVAAQGTMVCDGHQAVWYVN